MLGTVLVTGASGFIGRHLVQALREDGCNVLTFSTRGAGLSPDDFPHQPVQHVFHLAARTYVPDSWTNPADFYETNVVGSAKVLEFCRERKASVTLVSSYVYGKPSVLPISEEHPIQAFNPYGHSKILAEQIGRFYQTTFGVRVAIVRPFNLFGPYQDSRFLVPALLRQALDPLCQNISVADPRPRRDFLFITDFIRLLLRLRESQTTGTFNAGAGFSVSIEELAETINCLNGTSKPLISRGEPRPDEVFDVVADIGKARRELGWEPEVSLREGLARSLAALEICPEVA